MVDRPVSVRRVRPTSEAPAEPISRRARSAPEPTEDSYEEPRGRGRAADDDDVPEVEAKSGWGGWRQAKAEAGTGGFWLKLENNTNTLLKMLENEPFVTFTSHWVEGLKAGRKSFNCPGECPLDGVGVKKRPMAMFNVVVLAEGEAPHVAVWQCGPDAMKHLLALAEDRATAPLVKDVVLARQIYDKNASGNKYSWRIVKVKDRDLEDDYSIVPLSEDELDVLYDKDAKDKGVVRYDPTSLLREVADEVAGMQG